MSLLHQSQLFVKRNAPTILTVFGGAGVVVTSVLAVKATPKAMALIKQEKEVKGEELTKMEIVKTAGPAYIPAVISGVGTLACIFGANALNKRQQAALMSAYTLVDNSFKEYKNKLKELYGEETHNNIVDAIAVEKAQDMRIRTENLCTECDLSLEDSGSEPRLFYDYHSGRKFESTIERVMDAEYHLNRNYILRGYAYLNEFYEFLGIEQTDYGSVLGWAPNDDGMYWIDFNHHKTVLDDGLEVYIIEMPFEPTYDFWDY